MVRSLAVQQRVRGSRREGGGAGGETWGRGGAGVERKGARADAVFGWGLPRFMGASPAALDTVRSTQ